MTEAERKLIGEMRDMLLEDLYGQTKYSHWGHELAKIIHRADVALGDTHYEDFSKRRYPGPRKVIKGKRAA